MLCFGFRREIRLFSAIVCLLPPAGGVLVQANPVMYASSDAAELAVETRTSPVDDAVLDAAPEELRLIFPAAVHLVKLTLRDENRAWVEIDFRYNPRSATTHAWRLPELPPANYYTAEWAALTSREQLLRGSFSFAFGAGAREPSRLRWEREEFLRRRAGIDADTRYVAPPPTRSSSTKSRAPSTGA